MKILDFMDSYEEELKPGQEDEILDYFLGKILDASAESHAKAIRSLIPIPFGQAPEKYERHVSLS